MVSIVYKCCIYCTYSIHWDIVPIRAYIEPLYTILERLGLQMKVGVQISANFAYKFMLTYFACL